MENATLKTDAEIITDKALRYMYHDCDIDNDSAEIIASHLAEMLKHCVITKIPEADDKKTDALLEEMTVFVFADYAGIGGSRADYAASCVMEAADHYSIRLNGDAESKQMIQDVCFHIECDAIMPEREYDYLKDYSIITDTDIDNAYVEHRRQTNSQRA